MNILDAYMEEEQTQLAPVDMDSPLAYPTLAMVGEAGELANVVKKILRDKGGVVSDADRYVILDEVGDVFWYLSQILWSLGFTWEDAIAFNKNKLGARRREGSGRFANKNSV